jgi:hypothetical protein
MPHLPVDVSCGAMDVAIDSVDNLRRRRRLRGSRRTERDDCREHRAGNPKAKHRKSSSPCPDQVSFRPRFCSGDEHEMDG